MIPVARKVWQPIASAMPAARARRPIMRQASGWVIGFSGKHFAVVLPRGAEQPALAVFGDAGRVDISVQGFGQRVMARHRVVLAAFLVQPDQPAPRGRKSSTFIFKAAVMRANE